MKKKCKNNLLFLAWFILSPFLSPFTFCSSTLFGGFFFFFSSFLSLSWHFQEQVPLSLIFPPVYWIVLSGCIFLSLPLCLKYISYHSTASLFGLDFFFFFPPSLPFSLLSPSSICPYPPWLTEKSSFHILFNFGLCVRLLHPPPAPRPQPPPPSPSQSSPGSRD